MNNILNPKRIIMARESRGITQVELSGLLSIGNSYMSKIERGDSPASDEILLKIADITGYPASFFYQPGDIIAESLSFRKRETVAQRYITPIAAKANIIRLHVQWLSRQLGSKPASIPAIEVSDKMTPAQIAGEVRRQWKIKAPVIESMAALLEEHGIAISSFPFGTERVDSRCMMAEEGQPVIFLNSQMLGDRMRFSLAYELGHLVMHTLFTLPLERDITREANQFAAAFLMPEAAITRDLKGQEVTVALLGELKRKWKVSMIALLYRTDDLGFVTPNQKRYILQQFNQLQIRRREPVQLDAAIEQPLLLRERIAALKKKLKLDAGGMAGLLHLSAKELAELYG